MAGGSAAQIQRSYDIFVVKRQKIYYYSNSQRGNMMNVILMRLQKELDEPDRRRLIRKRSRILARLFQVAFAGSVLCAGVLAVAIPFYDGSFMSFGPGGIWFGQNTMGASGRVALTHFSSGQRFAGAVAALMLFAPVASIFHGLWKLFGLYAAGVVFSPQNATYLRRAALGLIACALAPFFANRLIMAFGIVDDPIWFHADEVVSLLLGCLLLAITDVMAYGRDIETDRDGFV